MGTQAFAKGDKVTVTLSGEVTNIIPFEGDRIELRIVDETGHQFYVAPDSGNVQRVEPPVEVFGPGTVVRGKGTRQLRALARNGYINLAHRKFYRYGDIPGPEYGPEDFTSEHFERVDLS